MGLGLTAYYKSQAIANPGLAYACELIDVWPKPKGASCSNARYAIRPPLGLFERLFEVVAGAI
jgi:hypothetical protein